MTIPDGPVNIGVDVGGTKVLAGAVDAAGNILASARRPTPSSAPVEVAETIAALVAELRPGFDIDAVGIGAAGFIDRERSHILFAPNLAWRDEPLREEVGARVGLPVVVENDANAMAWGEYRFGAGIGQDDLVCVTVGTGIGGGIVLDGALYRGRFGIGGEFGHMQVVPNGHICGCGNRGCWEQYASGRALVRNAREIVTSSRQTGARLLELAGGRIADLAGPAVTTAALEGDPAALKCFEEVGYWLGQGLADLAAVLDPGRFVIGGGVSDAGDLLVGPARAQFAAALTGRGHRPQAEIVIAALGPSAGIVGAADLARRSDDRSGAMAVPAPAHAPR